MTPKEYLEKRSNLLAEAQALLDAGKVDESKAKRLEIEDLDNEMVAITTEQANLAALEKQKPINLANQSLSPQGAVVVGSAKVKEKIDYETVFAKVALRRELNNEEIAVYNQFNPNNAYSHSTTNTEVLIPVTVLGGIQELMKELHPVLGELNETTITGIVKYKKHKDVKNGDAKYYAEAAATEDEENEFDEITLNGHELAKYVNVKWKLTQMAVDEFIPFIKKEIADRMAAAKANAVLKGTGTNQPKGIVTYLTTGAAKQVINSQVLKYEDFTAAMAKIASKFKAGTRIYCNSNTLWNGIYNLKDNNGNPLFVPSLVDNVPGKVFGKFAYEEDGLDDGEILIGNIRDGWKMNKQEPMKLLAGDDLKKRESFFAGYEVNDGAVYADEAFSLIKATKINGLVG